MDGIFIHKLQQELKEKLIGSYILKIYQLAPKVFNFVLRQRNQNFNLYIFLEANFQGLFTSNQSLPNPEKPTAFAMLLRKYLQGSILTDIKQQRLERILTLDFSRTQLLVELMGRSTNLILCQQDVILGANQLKSSKTPRPLLIGQNYTPPPSQEKLDLWQLTLDQLTPTANTPYWRYIFDTIEGIGPKTAKEIVYRAGVDPNTIIAEASSPQLTAIYQELMSLVVFLRSQQKQPCAVGEKQGPKDFFPFKPQYYPPQQIVEFNTFSEMLATSFLEPYQQQKLAQQKKALQNPLQKEFKKKQRKTTNLIDDYHSAKAGDIYRVKGELITAYAHQIKKGMTAVTLPNFYQEESPLLIELKPHLSPHANAQNYFKQYHKKKKALKYIQRELRRTQQDIAYLEQTMHFIEQASSEDDLAAIANEIIALGYYIPPRKNRQKSKPLPPRQFTSPQGYPILVGRNNKQNEELIRQAHKLDFWLHVKELPGSHVVLENREVSPELTSTDLEYAAKIAAFFSKAKGSSNVAVDYTQIKNLKKPRGAPPGFFHYQNYSTVYVTPPAQLQELKT